MKYTTYRPSTWWTPHILVALVTLCLLVSGLMIQLDAHAPVPLPTPVITPVAVNELGTQTPAPAPPLPTDCAKMPCLALTFDDGPNPITTPQILAALEQADVHASFFVIGSRAATMPSLLRRMYADGDEIGNHTWMHPDLTTLSAEQIQEQINRTQLVVTAAGVPAPKLFRPPYGAVNPLVKSQVHLTMAMWNIDPLDWKEKNPAKVTAAVLAQARPGAIIDMHDIYPQTAAAMPAILQNLKSRFQLVTVSQLFTLQPGQRGEFFGR